MTKAEIQGFKNGIAKLDELTKLPIGKGAKILWREAKDIKSVVDTLVTKVQALEEFLGVSYQEEEVIPAGYYPTDDIDDDDIDDTDDDGSDDIDDTDDNGEQEGN